MINKYWTDEDIDFVTKNKQQVIIWLISTFEIVQKACHTLTPEDLKCYLKEVKRMIDKTIEIGEVTKNEH